MNDDLDPVTDEAAPPARARRPGLAPLAILIALVALGLAAWNTWRGQRLAHADDVANQQLRSQLADLQSQLAAGGRQAQAGSQRLATVESDLDSLGAEVKGLGLRTGNLETAYANLSGQQQSARDTLLLNDVEMLLRTAQQRFELFHDSEGALKAYDQAIAVLGQIQDPTYAPVRASAMTERDALAAAAPPSRQTALDALSALRTEAANLPLANASHASEGGQSSSLGFWTRVAHSFRGIVRVTRDTPGAATPLADGRFARQALALDLAQAQEALLAFDLPAYRSALEQAAGVLSTQFDAHAQAVEAATAKLSDLLSRTTTGKPPQLGGALAQLRSLRQSQAAIHPAPATTSGSTQP